MNDKTKCPEPEEIKAMTPEELLKQFERLKFRVANRYKKTVERLVWIDAEDVYQVADIALLKAQKSYEPTEEASFMTYAYHIMEWEIWRALKIRWDGNGYTVEPITVSLDEPINEDGDITRGDLIPSDETPLPEQMETREIVRRVRTAVDALPEDQGEIIKRRYLNDPTESGVKIAEEKGVAVHIIAGKKDRAFKRLRKDLRDLQDLTPHHVGVAKFNTTWTSEPEEYVLAKESALKRLQESYKELFTD